MLAVVLGSAALGWFVPDLVLYQVSYDRTERMRRELPDALDLLTISVESGLSFDGSSRAGRPQQRGAAGRASSSGCSRRCRSASAGRRPSGRWASAPICPTCGSSRPRWCRPTRFGIPIANVLRVQAREMRIKRSQRAEEQAQKVPVKILFPLIFCIFPMLMVVILGPSIVTIAKTLFGVGG